jgi:hypothetical protein
VPHAIELSETLRVNLFVFAVQYTLMFARAPSGNVTSLPPSTASAFDWTRRATRAVRNSAIA